MSDNLQPAAASVPGYTCAMCFTPIADAAESVACPSCAAVYHRDCWTENGGCGVYGCKSAPAVEPRSAMEIPAGFWGRERKQCPVCNVEIAAAAVRCKNCGTTFSTATPVDRDAFRNQAQMDLRMPAARRMVIIIFVLCALPCTSTIGVVWGLIWRAMNRATLRALPSLYTALWTIGLIIGLLQTIGIIVFSMMYSLKHSF